MLVPVENVEALASAVVDLIGDEEKRRRLSISGRERIRERFSLERMVAETERLYQQVVDE